MPFGLGWEDPDPDASSGIGGDDEATAVEVAAASKTAASSAPPPPRNNSKKSGTRSDGRKTSTTRGSSGGGSSKRKTKSSQDASGVAAAAAAAPEAAEDDKPSPHKSRRHRSSRDGSGKNTSSAKGGAPAPPPRPRSSPRASSSGKHRSSGSRSRSSTKQASTRTRSSKSGGGTRTSSSGSRPSGSPRSSPRTSPRSSPGRDRNKTSMDSNTAAAAMAAATAAAGGAVVGAALVSPTETENTKESSHDSWRENGCDDAHDDIEAGGAASPRASSSPAKRSYKDKSGSGRQSGSGSRSKSAGKSGSRSKSSGGGKGGSSSGRHQSRNSSSNRHHQSSGGKSGGRSSSRRQTSRSRRKYDYVSCCGWEWKKTHLLFLVVAVILVAGGAVAALLFTGILGGGSSSQASDFSSVTNSPTAVPAVIGGSRPVPRPTWSDDGGNRPVASDQNQNQQPAATAPAVKPRPTSCTETTGLFKYFDDVGIVVTTNCKKVALSTEADEVKCQRTIVFGGGYIVRDICPVTCGECSGEDEGLVPTEKPTAFTLEPTPAPKPVAIPTLASPGFASHETFSFYVMGDIPYLFKQDLTLIEQLQDQTNTLDPKKEIFQVHVGDIQNPKRTQCASSHYDKIAGYYKTYSKLPNLILPGDNDWNDCPNPDQAWQYWQNNFVPFEQYWSDTSDFPSTVMRQAGQQENFAFTRGGVLFLGLNLVGGQTNAYVTEADWDRKIDNDIAWAEFHMDRLNVGSPRADPMDKDYIRAVIIFGHSPRGRRFNNFLMQRLYNSNLPVVYLHGNGHTYMAVQPFLSDGWSNYWRIQVDQGFNAPPAKVTVRGTTPEALRSSMSINGGKVFPGGFMKLDRRGGLYDGAVATDADGNPLISGVGG